MLSTDAIQSRMASLIASRSVREPLVQTQVLPYLRQLVAAGIGVSLLTFEPQIKQRLSQAELEGQRLKLADEGITLRDRLERLKVTEGALCPLCGQPLDEAHRQQLVEELEAEIVDMRARYSANQDRAKLITSEVKIQAFAGAAARQAC